MLFESSKISTNSQVHQKKWNPDTNLKEKIIKLWLDDAGKLLIDIKLQTVRDWELLPP